MVAVLTVLAALLRLPGLDAGMWFDEIVTLIESVRLPFRDLLTTYPGYNNHPLYSLLARVSVRTLGEHEWTIRLPAFVFGVAAIPLLFQLGKAVTTRTEAMMATVLLTVSYQHVWFSQNARGYTALMFFTLLATLLLVRLFERPRVSTAIAYGIASALGVYTHLTMAFVTAAHVAVWAWFIWRSPPADRSRRLQLALVGLGAVALVSGVLYLPMAADLYAVVTGPPPATAAVATPRWAVVETLRGLRVGFGALGLLAAGGLAALGTLSYLRTKPLVALLFLLPAPVSVLLMVTAGMMVRPRFFFSLLGFGLLILVRGASDCGKLVGRWTAAPSWPGHLGTVLVAVIALLSAVSLRYNYQHPKQDFAGALDFIESHRSEAEPVATGGLATLPYARYFEKSWTAVVTADQLESLRRGGHRVWVVYSFEEYMNADLVEKIHRDCAPQRTFPGTLGGGHIVVCTVEGRSAELARGTQAS